MIAAVDLDVEDDAEFERRLKHYEDQIAGRVAAADHHPARIYPHVSERGLREEARDVLQHRIRAGLLV